MITALLVNLLNLYCFVIFVYVMLSWFPVGGGIIGEIYRTLGMICDPFLDIFKRVIPPIGGTIDISPILALLVLQFAGGLVIALF